LRQPQGDEHRDIVSNLRYYVLDTPLCVVHIQECPTDPAIAVLANWGDERERDGTAVEYYASPRLSPPHSVCIVDSPSAGNEGHVVVVERQGCV